MEGFMKNYRELLVWKKSRYLLTDVFKITEMFPLDKEIQLKKEMQNSCVDILANMTKGFSSENNEELPQYLHISIEAVDKLEHHFKKAYDLRFLNTLDFRYLIKESDEIMMMLILMANVGENN
jgi:four helix bundle protein